MTPAAPVSFNKDQMPQEFAELRRQVELLPRPQREKMLVLTDRITNFSRLQGRLIRIAQEAVDQLQLDVKYLHFDLEATQRERDAYREELEGLEDLG
jgi:hypothetical protein